MKAFRIQKYIAWEVSVPFLLGIVLFTFVLLLSRLLKLIELVVNSGVSVAEIAGVFATLLPSFFVITVPLSFLLGIMLALGRFCADSELVAMKAAGLSIYRLAMPVFVLAIAVSLFTAFLTHYAEPTGRAQLRQRLIDIAYHRAGIAIQAQIFNEEIDGLVLYAHHVDPQTNHLQGVFISDRRISEAAAVITAERGEVRADQGTGKLLMHLEQGAIHRQLRRGDNEAYQVIHFDEYDVNLAFNDGQQPEADENPDADEMDSAQLLVQLSSDSEQQREYRVEFHERVILSLSPLVFSLLAFPLGIRSPRAQRGGGFAMALIIFLVYYLFLSVTKTMVMENGWPLLLSMWSPTFLFLSVGLLLFYTTHNERPLPGSTFAGRLVLRLNKLLAKQR